MVVDVEHLRMDTSVAILLDGMARCRHMDSAVLQLHNSTTGVGRQDMVPRQECSKGKYQFLLWNRTYTNTTT